MGYNRVNHFFKENAKRWVILSKEGMSLVDIAKIYRVPPTTVGRYVNEILFPKKKGDEDEIVVENDEMTYGQNNKSTKSNYELIKMFN